MIYIIDGASCSGKTYLAQKMLETFHIPYMSVDHLKMAFFRNGQLSTIMDDQLVTDFMFAYLKEMILTIIENKQHIILEGCYFHSEEWVHFIKKHANELQYICIVFSKDYLDYATIINNRNVIETRMYEEERSIQDITLEHEQKRLFCLNHHLPMIEIQKDFQLEIANWIGEKR